MKLNFEVNEDVINNTNIELTDLNSELWSKYKSAYGMVWDEVKAITDELEGNGNDEFEDIFDNLYEKLTHQMSFYNASYLAFPYMLKLLDKKTDEQDFDWQLKLISTMGIIVATDIENMHDAEDIDESLKENFNKCITILVEKTKKFILENIEQIAELDPDIKSFFYVSVLAILDDRKVAFAIIMGAFGEINVVCDECGEYNEGMCCTCDEECEEIEPAESVLEKWDGRNFDNTYMWYSNFLNIIGAEEEANALSYYYGTYTCPECDKKFMVMDVVKAYYFEE